DYIAAEARVDHPGILRIEKGEDGKEDQDEDAKKGKPHRRKYTAKQRRTRLDPLDDPRLRFLCDSYQGSANLRSLSNCVGPLDSCVRDLVVGHQIKVLAAVRASKTVALK